MKQRSMKLIAIVITIMMALSITTVVSFAEPSAADSLLQKIQNPDVGAKPMARMWLPDAGFGYLEQDGSNYVWMLEKQIKGLYDAGFGGVEMTMLSDNSVLFGEDAAKYGWGTPAHVNCIKAILKAANACENGFIVDITVTSHWPPVINTIDPNDLEQQQVLRTTYQKIKAADVATSGNTILSLPPQRVLDFSNQAWLQAPFFAVDRLQSSSIAKVTAVNASGVPTSVDFDSLKDMKGTINSYICNAGIPDYEEGQVVEITKQWDPSGWIVRDDLHTINQADVDNPALSYTKRDKGKIVRLNADGSYGAQVYNAASYSNATTEYGNKIMPIFNTETWGDAERMNDQQYNYKVTKRNIKTYLDAKGVTAASLDTDTAIKVGDYVLVNTYMQGSGQLQSGGEGILMTPRYYATDYFAEEGVQKVIDYWEENIMDDELRALLQQNSAKTNHASCIFEDSIEVHISSDSKMWTNDYLDEFYGKYGYDFEPYAALATGLLNATNDTGDELTRIKQDYQLLLGDLYANEHAQVLNDWTKTFGYSYRAQAYTLTGLDVIAAAIAVDIPEGDNSSTGDGLRKLRSAVNTSGKRYLSMESLTFGHDENLLWGRDYKVLNSDYSDGVNRIILHGTPTSRSYSGEYSGFPGWNFWAFGSWNHRQVWWEKYAHGFSDYLASVQALLQNGTQKVEVVKLIDPSSGSSLGSGDSLRTLMNAGYSYNILTEAGLKNTSASNGTILPNGPAYKAIIVENVSNMTKAAAQKLVEYAQAGVLIIFGGTNIPYKVYGSERYEGEDADTAGIITDLIEDYSNVHRLTGASIDQNEVLNLLKSSGIKPYASYGGTSAANLQATTEYDKSDGSYYYYFFNDNASGTLSTEVTLTGNGTPYVIDPYYRTVKQLDNYKVVDGKIVFTLDLATKDTAIIAVSDNYEVFPQPKAVQSYKTSALTAFDVDTAGWKLSIESYTPKYTVEQIKANTQLDPTEANVSTLDAGTITLDSWKNLAGVGNRVIGNGTYTKTFTLTAEQVADYAEVKIGHFTDNVCEVVINGKVYNRVNPLFDTVKTDALKVGENTIKVVIGSTPGNLAQTASGETQGAQTNVDYGLKSVTITPFAKEYNNKVIVTAPGRAILNEDFAAKVSIQGLDCANTFQFTATYDATKATYKDFVAPTGWVVLKQPSVEGKLSFIVGCPNDDLYDTKDIIQLNFNAIATGDFVLTVDKMIISGVIDAENGVTYEVEGDVSAASSTTTISLNMKEICDINKDGYVTIADLSLTMKYYGISSADTEKWAAAKKCDIDGNGAVDMADLILILTNYTN